MDFYYIIGDCLITLSVIYYTIGDNVITLSAAITLSVITTLSVVTTRLRNDYNVLIWILNTARSLTRLLTHHSKHEKLQGRAEVARSVVSPSRRVAVVTTNAVAQLCCSYSYNSTAVRRPIEERSFDCSSDVIMVSVM